MPVTLPAHAAAVLPLFRLSRWGVPPAALVLGACAPDLSYVLETVGLVGGADAHSLPGLFLFCLPVGLVTLVWLEVLLLPVLRRTLPEVAGVQWGRFLRTQGLPRSGRTWALAAGAVVLGAATHVLWDGFTHRHMWPAEALYPHVTVPVGQRELPLARVLQHASSLVGSLGVLGWLVRRYPRLPPVAGGSWRGFLPVLLCTGAGAAVGLALRLADFEHLGALEAQLWWTFWPTVTGALVGLTLGCAGSLRWPKS